ncbi:MAG TPA: mucoidy inhibitor MuiA family protein [Verrucomicrobiae bacterium]|nr:mucoidy inhibitor MuiA family protein [Verrucomicrobiae bacterium]
MAGGRHPAGKRPESFPSKEAPELRGAVFGVPDISWEINVKRQFLAATAVALFLPAAQLSAAELTALAPISNVIVYPDRAEVTRSIELRIPEGSTTLVVPGLPADIVPQSIRVFGEADGGVQVTTIATEMVRPEIIPFKPDPKIEAEIQALLKQKPPIEDRIAIAQMQCDYYKLLLAEAPQVSDKELIKSLDPQQWDSVWLKLSAKLAQAQDTIRSANAELQAIDEEIGRHRERQKPGESKPVEGPTLAAHVGVDAEHAATAKLRISYQISGVSWQPFYHASLNSGTGEVALVQYGEVRQHTGEDWHGVSLILSTARPAVGAVLPELTTWRLQDYLLQRSREELSKTAFGADIAGGLAPQNEIVIQPAVAQVAATEFAAEYRIPGKVDLVSGDDAQRVAIAEHRLKSHLAARIVPKVSLQAHLYATAAYDGQDPLLPGALTVFRDGALLGTSSLPLLRPQEEFQLGFGADDKIRVAHIETPVDPEAAGLFGDKRRIERQFVTTIVNYHRQPIDITLLDQLPVSSSESIDVELTRNTTPASEMKWQDQDGVIAWTGSYAPAEERAISFGYTIIYPQEMVIGGM